VEAEVVARSPGPLTRGQILEALRVLGLERGQTVLVHASLSALGWVAGGAQAVVEALAATVGPSGNLVMPSQSAHLSDPANWGAPPVPPEWWSIIRAETPAYDPATTPTRAMGAVAEAFRSWAGVLRSGHPKSSFAALGPDARRITADHVLTDDLGETSPLARLYELDAWVLLLGVGHARNTSLHLAENRAAIPDKPRRHEGSPILRNGCRVWVEYEELALDDAAFERIGADFSVETGEEREGPVGLATARLMRQKALVDYGVGWIERYGGTGEAALARR
jgi:aminoglycoside 3-N-acetyltransferase